MQMIRMLTNLSRIGFPTLINWTSHFHFCSVAHPHGAVVGLQCVIVVFPDHTHLLILTDQSGTQVCIVLTWSL